MITDLAILPPCLVRQMISTALKDGWLTPATTRFFAVLPIDTKCPSGVFVLPSSALARTTITSETSEVSWASLQRYETVELSIQPSCLPMAIAALERMRTQLEAKILKHGGAALR